MNLIEDRWIPVHRQNGEEEKIAPWELTSNFDRNPIVALAAPRPDFQGGLMQFLIGLLQTAAPPDEDSGLEWEDWFEEEPPEPEKLRAKFDPLVDCFHLDGDGPRFMQDLQLQGESDVGIRALLIDSPKKNTINNNEDHFVKRGCVNGICYACAATALFTFQTNAPAGGTGYRTSLRGGGPLTTLVALDSEGSGVEHETLWHNLWLNILYRHTLDNECNNSLQGLQHIFPWLAPTRTSESHTGQTTYPTDVHPLQMYWGMPSRIRLDFDNMRKGDCDTCGLEGAVLVTHFIRTNLGINYFSEGWQHPLSPYYYKGKERLLLPCHPQSNGFPYTHWAGLLLETDQKVPAQVVTEFHSRRQKHEQFRLWVFGYDMSKDKAKNWYETVFPLYFFLNKSKGAHFSTRIRSKIDASELVAGYVIKQTKEALNLTKNLEVVRTRFYEATEHDFLLSMKALYNTVTDGEDESDILKSWYNVIKKAGMKLFDDYTFREDVAFSDMKRIVQARKKLMKDLNGNKLRNIYTSLNDGRR